MSTTTRISLPALAALLAGTALPAPGQVPLTPRDLGMGNAYLAVARGNESLFLNPANLGLPGNPLWSVAFPQVVAGGTVLGPAAGDVPDILNFDDADDDRLREILDEIPAAGTDLRYDFRAPLATLQTGRFALGVSYGSVGEHTVGRDLVELLFFGYEEGRTDYSVDDTRGRRATFWDFAAAWGQRVGPVSVGVAGHYIRGGTLLRSRLFEPRIDVEGRDIEVDYRAVYAKSGSGYGVDLGLAYQPVPSVTLSAAVINAVHGMEWSDELYTRGITLNQEDFDNGEPLLLQERYETSEVRLDPSASPLEVYETAQGLYEEAYFPAVARLGAAWQGTRGTHLAAAWQSNLNDGRLSSAWDTSLGVGVQQRIPLLTLRAGFATNLDGATLLSGGVTLGVLELGVARLDEAGLGGAPRSGWIGTFGVGVRTRTTTQ